MKLILFPFALFILYFSFVPQGYAQSKPKKPTIEVSCLLWEGSLPESIYISNEKKYVEVIPFTTSRSLPHKITARDNFVLYVKRKIEDEETGEFKIVYNPVGSIKIPSGTKKVLFILFHSGKDDDLKIRMLAYDDSTKGFPEGSFRFVNFSKSTLGVKFAGSAKKLPAQKNTIMKSRIKEDGGLVPFLVYNSKGVEVYQTRLFAQTNGREIIFISPPKEKGDLPKVKFISQLLPK